MKNLKTIMSLSIVLMSGLTLQNCDRNDEPRILEISALDPDFMAYCYFKEGTWWVYKEKATGQRDSQWVTTNAIGSDTMSDGRLVDEMNLDMIIRKGFGFNLVTNRGYSYGFRGINRCGKTPEKKEEHTCFLASYQQIPQNLEIGATNYLEYKPVAGADINYASPGSSHHYSKVIRIIDSFQIDANQFGQSIETSIERDANDLTSDFKKMVISKHFGISQFSYKTADTNTYPSGWQIWNLVNYNIVQ